MSLSKRWPVFQSREQQIADLAEAVAEEYCPSGIFDPEPVLEENRITISFGHYNDCFDGMLEQKNGHFHIYCNLDRVQQPDSPRARFTIGHELGHFFIDEHRNALISGKAPAHPSKCEYESNLSVEKEADAFASHLLMPGSSFDRRARAHKVGLKGILALAVHFGTSVTSTAIRYARSDFVPCVVMKWSDGDLNWRWISTEAFRARLRKTVENPAKLPVDSPTARALAGEEAPETGFFEAGTTAAAWFPFLRDYELPPLIV